MTQNYFRPTHNVNMSELSELLANKTEYGEFYLGTVSYKVTPGNFPLQVGKRSSLFLFGERRGIP